MKTIERLRKLKTKATDRMAALVQLASTASRDLTTAEQEEYNSLKEDVEAFDADIAELSAAPAQPGPTLVPNAAPAAPAANDQLALARQEGAQAENARVIAIRQAVNLARRTCPSLAENLEATLTAPGVTVEVAREKIFEAMAAAQTANNISSHHTAGISRDAADTFREKMENALLVRCDTRGMKPEHIQLGREFAGLSLLEMAREYLRFAGVKTSGLSKTDVARIALQGQFGAQEHFAGGLMTSSDFPNILANVANKTLRQAYEAAPQTFKPWCRQTTLPDFKPVNRTQLSDVPTLLPINEHGEFKRVSVSDGKETYQLTTYGEIVGITRKTIINDDLSALSRIPAGMGQAAATLESDTVYAVLTANAAMNDAIALFHASHSNLNTANALADAGLGVLRKNFRLQTAPKGTVLNLTPKFILAPAALEQTLLRLIASVLYPAVYTNAIPEWIRSLTPVIDPRLDANSTTAWYGIADPAQIDTIEYAYLEGQQGVYIETRQGFEVDGIEIKARLDFAAAAIDYRGMAKNTP